jgi:hypothetical protein
MNSTTVYCYRTYAFIFTLCHILHHSSSSSSQFGALSASRPKEIDITNHSFIHQEVFHSVRFQRQQYHKQNQHKKHHQQQYHNEQCSYRIDDVTTTNDYFSVVDSLRLLPYHKYSILPIDWMFNDTATTSNSNNSTIDLNIIIIDPSRYEVLRSNRYQHHIPQMMTLSDSLLLTGLVNNTKIGSAWFQQKRTSWVLPLTHRRQNRTSCYQAIMKASSSLPIQLYQPIQMIYPWYMIIVTYAIVHPTGALALSCGLYQPLHSCDTHDVFNEDFKNWYQRCFLNMTQYMHHLHNYHHHHHLHNYHHRPQQQRLTYNNKKELMALVWNHFYHHIQHYKSLNDIKYGTHVGFDRFYYCNIKHINYYPSIFLATGYGDTNYYHFIITDLLRLIRAIPWLQRHTNIFIHIGHLFDPSLFDDHHHSTKNDDDRNNRFLNMNMQSHILQYFGIDKSRIVTGIVFGKVIYIPRPIRCDEHEYHSGEIRMLSDIMIHMASSSSSSSSSSFPNSDNTNTQIIDIDDDSNNHHDNTIITHDTIHNVDDRKRGSSKRSGSRGSSTRISSSRSRGGSSRGKVNEDKRYLLPIYKKSSSAGKKDFDYDHHHDQHDHYHHQYHQKNDIRNSIDKNRLKRMKRAGSIKPLIVILARINDDDKRMNIDNQGIRTFTTMETLTLARKMKQLMIDHRVIVFNESVLPHHQHHQHHNRSSRGSDNINDSDRNKNRTIPTTSNSCLTCRINIFIHTSILVSVHGAGLVNLIFMKPSTLIVEIVMKFTPVALPYCGSFGRLAHVMNIHHLSIYYDSIYYKSLSTTNITQHIVNKIHYMWYEHIVRQRNGNNSNTSLHHHQHHHGVIQRAHKIVKEKNKLK